MAVRDGLPESWGDVREEAVMHLQRLIRFPTVNPPGNELPLARYLHDVLTGAGIESTLLEPAPERGTVVARLRGSGRKDPVLLMAHMDVVAVEPARWTHDPFGGEVHDGFLYGRGAIDDKGMLAANLVTMLLLRRWLDAGGGQLSRDVIFLATADEETGGPWGIDWVIATHPELIRAEFAINEGGRTRIIDGKPLYVAVQTTEKVSHALEVVARGTSGHASIPLPDNPLIHLGRALATVGAHHEPVRLNATTREFFARLGTVWPDEAERRAMLDVASSEHAFVERGARVLAQVPVMNALLRNSISPTMVEGGVGVNVIPAEARATINVRTLPATGIEEVIDRLQAMIADDRVEVRKLGGAAHDPPPSSFTSPLFEALVGTADELLPGLLVAPYMSTGATDSAVMRNFGVQCYGILPFPMDQEDENRMHSHDERISVDSLLFGTRFLFSAVRRVAS